MREIYDAMRGLVLGDLFEVERNKNRAILRAAVQRTFMCGNHQCARILDCEKTAVLWEDSDERSVGMMCTDCADNAERQIRSGEVFPTTLSPYIVVYDARDFNSRGRALPRSFEIPMRPRFRGLGTPFFPTMKGADDV